MDEEEGGVPVSRSSGYVTQRLDELERGGGDYGGFRRPSAATVAHDRVVAAQVFRDTTPTPSVVPDEDGNVLFVWHKNGIDAEVTVSATVADVWVHDRNLGDMWSGSMEEYSGCCVKRLLDHLEEART